MSPLIIMKHIDLFRQNKYPILLEFNKGLKEKNKLLKYVVDDICCEYCYKSLVNDLFEKQFINSVKSNADFHGSVFEVYFEIGYINYTESELIDIIKECL